MNWPTEPELDDLADSVVNVAGGTACDVYIGRNFAGRTDEGWGNPFAGAKTDDGRRRAVVRYFEWLNGPDRRAGALRARIRNGELTGKTLGCWCAADPWWTRPCHGHVLAGLAAGRVDAVKRWIHALDHASAGKGRRTASAFGPGDVGLAVDGDNFAHRAWHARPDASIDAFVSLLERAVKVANPDFVVICFDGPGPSERRALRPSYKGQRSAKDPALGEFLTMLPGRLEHAGLALCQPEGWEADDALAAYGRAWAELGGRAVLATGDRDVLACVTDEVHVLRPGENDYVTPDVVQAKYGIGPHQYLEFATLRGDPSDNLDGVAGIGPKRAAEILAQGTLDGLAAAQFAGVRPGVAAKLVDAWDEIVALRSFMRLRDELDVDAHDGGRDQLDVDRLASALGPRARRLARTQGMLLAASA